MAEHDALPKMHATTILMVRKGGRVVIGGDGQVSLGQTKAGFIGLSEERAETRIWERIEADLPELMAKYAGSELDFDVNSPA